MRPNRRLIALLMALLLLLSLFAGCAQTAQEPTDHIRKGNKTR